MLWLCFKQVHDHDFKAQIYLEDKILASRDGLGW